MKQIRIVNYVKKYQPVFERLNRAWIEQYFSVESGEELVLTRPEEVILKPGGAILVALFEGVPAGVVALKKVENGVFEFTKLAVDERFRRRGIAEAITHAAIRKGQQLGGEKIILYSQRILTGAIALYEKLGFRHVPVKDSVYKRADVKMELDWEKYNRFLLRSMGSLIPQ